MTEKTNVTKKAKETKKEKRARVFPEIQQRLGIQIREVLNESNEIRWVLTGNTKPLKEMLKEHGLFFHATPYTPDVAHAGIVEPHWETDRPRKFDALLDDLMNVEKVAKLVETHEAEEIRCIEAEKQLKSLVETAPGEVTMPWGKHQGEKLSEIPLDYVEWLASNFETKEPLKTAARKVVEVRKAKVAEKLQAKPAGDVIINFGKHSGKKISEIPLDYVEWLSREAQSETVRQKAREWVAQSKATPPASQFLNSPPPNVPSPAEHPHDIVRRHGRTPKPDAKSVGFSRNLGFGKRVEAMQAAPKVGEVVKGKSGPMVVVSVGEPRYYTSEMLEDFDMFGDEPGWQIHYTAVAVERTAEEQSSEDKKQAEIQRKKAAKEHLDGAFKGAEYPPKPAAVVGETYRMPLPRAGFGVFSRTSYRLDKDGGKIWEIRENGADGDDWSSNNWHMNIARFVPYTEELAAAIREVGEKN